MNMERHNNQVEFHEKQNLIFAHAPWEVAPFEDNPQSEELEYYLTPPGFDLGIEREKIQVGLDSLKYKQRFFENAKSYAREHLAKITDTTFVPYIINKNNDESITLTAEGYNGPVAELYNPNRRDWPSYRKNDVQFQRALVEYNSFRSFEQSSELKNAQVGDLFIWNSPPPSNLLNNRDFQALKKLGYGFHSFTFVYEIKEDSLKGNKYIESKAIRQYLRSKDQARLLNLVGGSNLIDNSDPTDLDLLSHIVKVTKPELRLKNINEIIDNIYKDTPEGERIIPHISSTNLSEEAVNTILTKLNNWLEGIYYLMYFDRGLRFNELIEKNFHGWEEALKDLLSGSNKNLNFEIIDPKDWAVRQMHLFVLGSQDTTSDFYYYTKKDYKPEAGGCGLGSGFGEKEEKSSSSNPRYKTSYESADSEDKNTFTGECPVCGMFVVDLKVGEHCGGCDTQYLCAEE